MTITGKQIAMARILLDLNQQDLADTLDLARKTILRIENSQSPGSRTNMDKIRSFFEQNGIEFLENNGLRRKENTITTLTGRDGLSFFRRDMLDTIRLFNGSVKTTNPDGTIFTRVNGEEQEKQYVETMQSIKNLDFKGLVAEGDYCASSDSYAQVRWIPKGQFMVTPFYLYGEKLAIILNEEEIKILLIHHPLVAHAYEVQFNLMWEKAIIPPKTKKAAS